VDLLLAPMKTSVTYALRGQRQNIPRKQLSSVLADIGEAPPRACRGEMGDESLKAAPISNSGAEVLR